MKKTSQTPSIPQIKSPHGHQNKVTPLVTLNNDVKSTGTARPSIPTSVQPQPIQIQIDPPTEKHQHQNGHPKVVHPVHLTVPPGHFHQHHHSGNLIHHPGGGRSHSTLKILSQPHILFHNVNPVKRGHNLDGKRYASDASKIALWRPSGAVMTPTSHQHVQNVISTQNSPHHKKFPVKGNHLNVKGHSKQKGEEKERVKDTQDTQDDDDEDEEDWEDFSETDVPFDDAEGYIIYVPDDYVPIKPYSQTLYKHHKPPDHSPVRKKKKCVIL